MDSRTRADLLKDLLSREGWEIILELKAKFQADKQKKVAADLRLPNSPMAKHYQGAIDGLDEFFVAIDAAKKADPQPAI